MYMEPRHNGKKHGRDGARNKTRRQVRRRPGAAEPFLRCRTIPAPSQTYSQNISSVSAEPKLAPPKQFSVEPGTADPLLDHFGVKPGAVETYRRNRLCVGNLGLMPLKMPFRPFLYK